VGQLWQERRELRGAIYRRDWPALLRLLDCEPRTDQLQLAGAGLLVALADEESWGEVARRLSAALRERRWVGDQELAEEIDAALVGRGTGRRAVPVDLSELADSLEGGLSGDAGGLLDLVTGQIWPGEVLDYPAPDLCDLPDVDDDPDRWLELPTPISGDRWRDMRDFAEMLPEPHHQRLRDAIDGRGAFRRFRRELDRAGEDVRDRWLAFREERALGRTRAWLAGDG